MKKTVAVAAFVAGVLAMLRAQSFDVAAIKQNKSGDTGGRFGGPPGRFTATNAPALPMISFSYQVQEFQVEGGPDWIRTDRYDVNARAEGNFPPTTVDGPDPRRQMLKALLIDRFKLAAHIESRERPIYALVAARQDKVLGPQLRPSTTDCVAVGDALRRGQASATPPRTPSGDFDCGIRGSAGRISFGTQPMTQIADTLSGMLRRGVVDRTGIAGNYSGAVTFTPDTAGREGGPDVPAADPNGASLFTAFQEQLGLKLEPSRGMIDVLIIDHIERPTED